MLYHPSMELISDQFASRCTRYTAARRHAQSIRDFQCHPRKANSTIWHD